MTSPNAPRSSAEQALDRQIVQDLARSLDEAEKTGRQVRQFSLAPPEITIEDAYRVQKCWVDLKVSEGRKIHGHKIGLTSRAMQRSSSISEPDYGVLLDDMFMQEGSDIPISRFIAPRVEVELAFVLKHALTGPNCNIFDVLAATKYVVPAIEIIDARIQQIDPDTKVTRKVFDTISDNAANAGVVLGGRPFLPDGADLRWISAVLFRNGVIEETGVAAAVLNHPAHGPAWLANKLYRFGVTLEPGQVILGGSFTAPVQASRGDTFLADYGPFGTVAFRFI